jgi:hypothetical protein
MLGDEDFWWEKVLNLTIKSSCSQAPIQAHTCNARHRKQGWWCETQLVECLHSKPEGPWAQSLIHPWQKKKRKMFGLEFNKPWTSLSNEWGGVIWWIISGVPEAHTCNPSYSGGRDLEDSGLKPAWERPYLKKWAGGALSSSPSVTKKKILEE